jgi:2-keto-3-deoxy-L-rhamnonate aldolase RhmA
MPTDDDWARRYREHGFRMMAYGADTLLLQHALASGLHGLRK